MNNNYIFKLVTGHNISYNCNSTLTGSIFEYPYIKNELDINAPLSKFKVDDYIYLEKINITKIELLEENARLRNMVKKNELKNLLYQI